MVDFNPADDAGEITTHAPNDRLADLSHVHHWPINLIQDNKNVRYNG